MAEQGRAVVRRDRMTSTLGAGLWVALLPGFLVGCQTAGPVTEKGDLVEITALAPTIRLDIRYATANNFTGRALYPEARAFLLREPAAALNRVNRSLSGEGYGLLVYDAYRPWAVTRALWDAASPDERRMGYVADPEVGSRHNRGCAVDVGLYELGSGREVAMPSGYDDFSERGHAHWSGGAPEARQARGHLRRAMEAEGFTVLWNEWWHFDFRGCDSYPVMNVPFEGLPRRTRSP